MSRGSKPWAGRKEPIANAPSYPLEVEVVHCTSGVVEKRTATHEERGIIFVLWPLCGAVRFAKKTGRGKAEAPSWSLTEASLETIRAIGKPRPPRPSRAIINSPD